MGRILYTDIETYSGTDIKKSGSYKYMEDPDFEILLLAYAWDDEPVRVLDLTLNGMTNADRVTLAILVQGLTDPDVLKISHNCAFERNAYRVQFGEYMPPSQWLDTMILAAYNGLPMSLEACGEALNLPQQKLKEGATLIRYFCQPCKPTIANGGRTRNLPEHAPEKWARFKEYATRDVVTMRDIYKRLNGYKATDFERSVWITDCAINERGVLVDLDLARSAVDIDARMRQKCTEELQRLTGLPNPNSVSQLKDWLEVRGVTAESLDKGTVSELLGTIKNKDIRRVLELRQLLGKTSTKKYEAMLNAACADHRIRGLTQYYGAGRTGRWAGRLVQLQNLPQNHLESIGDVREIAKAGDLDLLELLYDSVPDTLSQLIRTAFIAKPGHTFLVADYAAIEARVIAYLAGEKWRQEVFAQGGDIYCSSASQMFHVPVVKHGINGHLRQKGKIAELACGYGGGVSALRAFGADKLGLTEEEMQTIVTNWRAASPSIPRFWRDAENAARNALKHPGQSFGIRCGVRYLRDKDALRCRLPSGRVLSYWGAQLRDGSITFMAQNQTTRKWERAETWGGKLVENIVQAYARDCLSVAMVRLEAMGQHIVFHVHDEVIVEAPEGSRWQQVAEVMGYPISWAPGLLLRGDGYETKFYMKD